MFIEKTEQNLVKISFNAQEEEIFLADMLKIASTGTNGVIAQVANIESPEQSGNLNTATAKILFTIHNSGKLTSWQGNMPGKKFKVSVVDAEEYLAITGMNKIETPVFMGQMPGYPGVGVNIDAVHLEKPSLVVGDNEELKIMFLKHLACELSEKSAKVVIADVNGDFLDTEGALVLKACKDVKLPLDIKGLENLYNKTLTKVSAETRANIENIFDEIEEYLVEENATHIPFSSFLGAVSAEYEEAGTPELSFLNNNLAKLYRKGLFADSHKEINRIFNSFRHNGVIVLDLSEVDQLWCEDFIETQLRLNREIFKRKFFLINTNESRSLAQKILNTGYKSGISPIFSVGHESGIISEILPRIENIFALSAFNGTKLASLEQFLNMVGPSEVIIKGKITNNVPVFLKLSVLEQEGTEIIIDQSFVESAGALEEELSAGSEAYQSGAQDDEVFQSEEEFSQEIEPEEEYSTEETAQAYEEVVAENVSEEYEEDEIPEYYEEEEQEEYYQEEPASETDEEADSEAVYEDEEVYQPSEIDEDEDDDEPQVHVSEEDRNLDLLLGNDEIEEEQPGVVQSYGYEEAEGDDDFDYSQSEEFQDESVLDYIDEDDEEQVYGASGDEMTEEPYEGTGEVYEENEQEDYESQYAQQFSTATQEYTSEDINNFVDLDDEEIARQEALVQAEAELEDDEQTEEEDYDEQAEEVAQEVEIEEPQPVKKTRKRMPGPPTPDLPVYNVSGNGSGGESGGDLSEFKEGDTVKHKKYGIGEVKKVIGYSERRLCSIQFEEVGRRLLDPKLAELELVSKI